jgi:hypothetical protein
MAAGSPYGVYARSGAQGGSEEGKATPRVISVRVELYIASCALLCSGEDVPGAYQASLT